jgi:hypothetical protein
MWTYDADTKGMVHREVKYVPGFFAPLEKNIEHVDEILVNAADNKIGLSSRNHCAKADYRLDKRCKYGHPKSYYQYGGKHDLSLQQWLQNSNRNPLQGKDVHSRIDLWASAFLLQLR